MRWSGRFGALKVSQKRFLHFLIAGVFIRKVSVQKKRFVKELERFYTKKLEKLIQLFSSSQFTCGNAFRNEEKTTRLFR